MFLIFYFSTRFNEHELALLSTAYNGHKLSEAFLYNYEAADIAAIKLSTDSSNIWSISPPDREKMLSEVNSCKFPQEQRKISLVVNFCFLF